MGNSPHSAESKTTKVNMFLAAFNVMRTGNASSCSPAYIPWVNSRDSLSIVSLQTCSAFQLSNFWQTSQSMGDEVIFTYFGCQPSKPEMYCMIGVSRVQDEFRLIVAQNVWIDAFSLAQVLGPSSSFRSTRTDRGRRTVGVR